MQKGMGQGLEPMQQGKGGAAQIAMIVGGNGEASIRSESASVNTEKVDPNDIRREWSRVLRPGDEPPGS